MAINDSGMLNSSFIAAYDGISIFAHAILTKSNKLTKIIGIRSFLPILVSGMAKASYYFKLTYLYIRLQNKKKLVVISFPTFRGIPKIFHNY